jgi:hypothetical protein
MAQQTAVEWLQDTWLNYPDLCTYEKIQEWFDQAKAMEKEMIMDAYEQGIEDGYWHPENGHTNKFDEAEQYYNETYNLHKNTP